MPQNQGKINHGGIWIVEDDREVAQALFTYLHEHLTVIDKQPTRILPGPEAIQARMETRSPPAVVIVGTEHPNQTALDVVQALQRLPEPPNPLVIALGIPHSEAPKRVFWEMWPAAEEPALAERVRQGLFGGPQSPTPCEDAS